MSTIFYVQLCNAVTRELLTVNKQIVSIYILTDLNNWHIVSCNYCKVFIVFQKKKNFLFIFLIFQKKKKNPCVTSKFYNFSPELWLNVIRKAKKGCTKFMKRSIASESLLVR
jgi:hypothetical protein